MEDTGTFSALPQEEQQELEQTLSQNRERLPACLSPPTAFALHCAASASHACRPPGPAKPPAGRGVQLLGRRCEDRQSWHDLMTVASSIVFSTVNALVESAQESADMAPGACDMVHNAPIRTNEV